MKLLRKNRKHKTISLTSIKKTLNLDNVIKGRYFTLMYLLIIRRLLDSNPLLLQGYGQVIRSHDILLLIVPLLDVVAAGLPHLTVCQGIRGKVRDELMCSQGHEGDHSLISSIHASFGQNAGCEVIGDSGGVVI